MRALILLLPLLLAAFPAFAAETPIAPVENGPAYGTQSVLAIGTNANGEAFVVWQDVREGGYARINGSRVTDDGELRDPFGISIAPMTALSWSVRVFGDGDGWIVEYEADTRGTRPRYRIDANGTVSGPTIAPASAPFRHELLGGGNDIVRASNGEETLIVGRRTSHEASQIVTFRLNAAGALVGEPVVFPPLAIYRGNLIDLVWTGHEYVLLFQDERKLHAQRIDRHGAPIGNPINLANDAVASTSWLVPREDGSVVFVYRLSFDRIRVVRLGRDGQMRILNDIRTTDGVIANHGRGYLLAWNVGNGIVVEPLSNDFVLHASPTVEESLSPNAQKNFNSDRTLEARLLVWEERDGERGRIMGRRPEAAEKFELWPSAADQRQPAIARLGDSHFVVWYEGNAVRGMLFDYYGDPLLYEPLTIGGSVPPPNPYGARPLDAPPAVVWTGHYFLVAWNHGTQLHVARVTAGGVVIHDQPATPRPFYTQGRPVLVRAGSIVWLVYQVGDIEEPCIIFCGGGLNAQIHAVRFTLAGQRIDDKPLLLSNEQQLHARPDAAWNGRMLLVTSISNGKLYAREVYVHGNVYAEGVAASAAKSGSVIAIGEWFSIAADTKLWRDGNGVRRATERVVDGIPRIMLDVR